MSKSLAITVSTEMVETSLNPVLQKLKEAMIHDFTIEDDEEREVFVDVLHQAAEVEKELKARKDFIFKPWREMQKNINALFFNGPEEQVTTLKERVKKALLAYDKAKEVRIQKALEEARTESVTLLDAPRAPARTMYGHGTGTTKKSTWTPVVTDKSLVPDAYKEVDIAALRKLAVGCKKEKPPVAVPGVQWTLVDSIQMTKKSSASEDEDL